ncbi:MAG TPA: tRNA pseudouridine(38-40) synthase TruA [Micromonosporaceae bacterium]|nr:tRNA pseudouridine(38-40) synthase TruA [Micromonosporaceae bacterium]
MIRLRLDLAYDGTDFSGWAPQPGRRTVADTLMDPLTRVFGAGAVTGLTVAGRTDAGVHATGQVCHVDVADRRWREVSGGDPDRLVRRLARMLPDDVRVYRIQHVPASFDARFSALWRRYEYRVCDAPWGAPPLRRRDTLAWARPLDVAALNAAAAGLVGEHDFAAFCRRRENGSTVRAITAFGWRRDPDGIVVASVTADAFCHSMVRSLVGALLAVGDGRRPVTWPASLLDRRERASEVVVAPPHGLTLVEVGYPADADGFARRAAITRNRRAPAAADAPMH